MPHLFQVSAAFSCPQRFPFYTHVVVSNFLKSLAVKIQGLIVRRVCTKKPKTNPPGFQVNPDTKHM